MSDGRSRPEDTPGALALRTRSSESREAFGQRRAESWQRLVLRGEAAAVAPTEPPVVAIAPPEPVAVVPVEPPPATVKSPAAGLPPMPADVPVPPIAAPVTAAPVTARADSTVISPIGLTSSTQRGDRLPTPIARMRPPDSTSAAREISGIAPMGGAGMSSTNGMILRKKNESGTTGGRDAILARVANPVCYNCRDPFEGGNNLKPLSRLTCPRCSTRQVVPARIDQFVIERELGKGGMGTTYRAFDTSLHRNVALKLISDLHASHNSIDDIIHEARRAAALSHPNIVPVYSIGSVQGMPFIVMELLSDQPLSRRVSKGIPVEEEFALQTGLAIARALASAAEAGILHLDIKPANILHDRFGVAKLIDFGLACHLNENRSDMRGTCLYMAPERLRERTQDFRSDQYSLGLTLWHALAGKVPLDAENLPLLIDRILTVAPPLLSDIRTGLNPWTIGLIHQMIAHKPADRYQSYDDLVWAFEFVLNDMRESAHPQSP